LAFYFHILTKIHGQNLIKCHVNLLSDRPPFLEEDRIYIYISKFNETKTMEANGQSLSG